MTKCAELLNQTIEVDFVDINVGCPIDLVYKKVRRRSAARFASFNRCLSFASIPCCPICSCQSDPELPVHLWALCFIYEAGNG